MPRKLMHLEKSSNVSSTEQFCINEIIIDTEGTVDLIIEPKENNWGIVLDVKKAAAALNSSISISGLDGGKKLNFTVAVCDDTLRLIFKNADELHEIFNTLKYDKFISASVYDEYLNDEMLPKLLNKINLKM